MDVATLLVTDNHDRLSIESGRSADDGVVLSETAVAIEFGEVGEDGRDVIEGVGAGFCPGEKDLFPGAEARITNLEEVLDALFEFIDAGFESLTFDSVSFFVGELFEF